MLEKMASFIESLILRKTNFLSFLDSTHCLLITFHFVVLNLLQPIHSLAFFRFVLHLIVFTSYFVLFSSSQQEFEESHRKSVKRKAKECKKTSFLWLSSDYTYLMSILIYIDTFTCQASSKFHISFGLCKSQEQKITPFHFNTNCFSTSSAEIWLRQLVVYLHKILHTLAKLLE